MTPEMNELKALRKFFWDYKQALECGKDEKVDKCHLLTHSYNLADMYYLTQNNENIGKIGRAHV